MNRRNTSAFCLTAAMLACVPVFGWAQTAADGTIVPTEMGTLPEAEVAPQNGGTMAEGAMPMDGGMTAQDDAAMVKGESMMAMEGGMAMVAPDPLLVYFASGSAQVSTEQQDKLDKAVRTFRDGNWIVLTISGVADTVGDPEANLDLSLRRARAVADGLVARGVSVQQIQVLGRGNSELEVATEEGVSEEMNRVATITWR